MNNSVFKISLDIHKPESQVLLNVKKLDTNRTIKISLTENGKPYQITTDCSAVFTAEKADGNKICNDCRIENDVIVYDVTQQTVACTGIVDCEIRLFDPKGSVLTSPRFIILVNERIYNGEEIVESVIEADVLQSLLESRHSHKNKDIIDKITQEMLDMIGAGTGGLTPQQLAELTANTAARHEHENKMLLDDLVTEGFNIYFTPSNKRHLVYTSRQGYLVKSVTNEGNSTTIELYKGEHSEFVVIKEPPTKTSQLVNDSEFITKADVPVDRIELTTETATLEPNTHYSFGEVATLTLEFAEGDSAKVNEYMFSFISGETATVLTLPDTVKWVNELTVEANKRYEISIVDNIGLWCAVEVSE